MAAHLKRREAALEKNESFYKTAKETLGRRNIKKLTDKVLWYKGWKENKHQPEAQSTSGRKGGGSRQDKRLEIASLLFVARTEGGTLAEALREEEAVISKQSGYRVKIVERAGKKLSEVLVRSGPFAGKDCTREDCRPCLSKAVTLK